MIARPRYSCCVLRKLASRCVLTRGLRLWLWAVDTVGAHYNLPYYKVYNPLNYDWGGPIGAALDALLSS